MSQSPNPRVTLKDQLIRALLSFLLVSYVVAFFSVTLQSCRVKRQVEELRREVTALEQEQEALQKELDYAKSDEYAEKVAREELKWSRPGEKVFVPVPGGEAVPQRATLSADSSKAAPASGNHWQEWLELFFGQKETGSRE